MIFLSSDDLTLSSDDLTLSSDDLTLSSDDLTLPLSFARSGTLAALDGKRSLS